MTHPVRLVAHASRLARLLALAVASITIALGSDVHAQRRPHRAPMTTLVQSEQLFAQAKQAAEELVNIEIQPGDANGQIRGWDSRWSSLVTRLDGAAYSTMCASTRAASCVSRAVDALLCYVGQDLRLAREGAFDEERYFYSQLPSKMQARRVVADEALRREREALTCEDLERVDAAQIRLDTEAMTREMRARRAGTSSSPPVEAGSRSQVDSADVEATDEGGATDREPAVAPQAQRGGALVVFGDTERAMRDVVAAVEDLDIVFVDGIAAARRRSMPDALRLLDAVEAWKLRWPEVPRDLAILSAMDCSPVEPTQSLTCGMREDLSRWTRGVDAARGDRNFVRGFNRAHVATRELLRRLRGRLRRADSILRQHQADALTRLLADG